MTDSEVAPYVTRASSHTQKSYVGASKMEMMESASGLFRVVPPAVELHASQSIDEANRLFPFFVSTFCASLTSTGDVDVFSECDSQLWEMCSHTKFCCPDNFISLSNGANASMYGPTIT